MKNIQPLSDPYNSFVDFVVEIVFDDQQRLEYKAINDACGKCFLLAKQNLLDEAKLYFEESNLLFNSAHNKHWISALCLPNISYYQYKIGDYESAISHTNQIINSLGYLQANYYPYLFFSEIQQYHNLGRIYFSMGRVSLAVDQCIYCLLSIVAHSNTVQSNNLIYGVPELELYNITRYAMTIQVLSEACDKLIFYSNRDLTQLQNSLGDFMKQLSILDFASISNDPRYMAIDQFVEVMNGVLTNNYDEFQEHLLLFSKNPHADKTLLKIVYKYINSVLTAA